MSVSPNGQALVVTDASGGVLFLNGNTGGFKYGYKMTGNEYWSSSFLSDSTLALVSGFSTSGPNRYP